MGEQETDHQNFSEPVALRTPGQETLEFSWDAHRVTVEQIPVRALLPADSPRLTGEDNEHVRLLVASEAQLPPIIVHRPTMRVIDGMHRLHAAVERGQDTIDVRFFEGSGQDAFVLAVQLNITHGLPLTRADRTAAAERIITMYPSWSDRLIASVTGLSAGTVRTLRYKSGPQALAATRVGRDGRHRPIDAVAGRLAASRVVAERPESSLREIARRAGVSLATARDVRERVQNGQDPLPPLYRARSRRAEAAAAGTDQEPAEQPLHGGRGATLDKGPISIRPEHRGPRSVKQLREYEPDVTAALSSLARDPSLRFTESGRRLLRWLFTLSGPLASWSDVAETVPPHCSYMVAELARQCADEWLGFAAELTKRTDQAGLSGAS